MTSSFDVVVSLRNLLDRSSSFDVEQCFLLVLPRPSSLASPPPLPLPPRPSWISGRDPLLVVASCNSPEIHPNLNFRLLRCCVNCLACLQCLLHQNKSVNISSPYSRTGRRPTPYHHCT